MTLIIREDGGIRYSEDLVLGSGVVLGTTALGEPELRPDWAGVRAYLTADVALPSGVATAIGFDAESYDVGGFHATSGNTVVFPIPAELGGTYLAVAVGVFGNGPESARTVRIRRNAGVVEAETTLIEGGEGVTVVATAVLQLSGGGSVDMQMLQGSGAALAARGGNASRTSFTLARLGPK